MMRFFLILLTLLPACPLYGQTPPVLPANDFVMVNIRAFAPSIAIDLRYATARNIAGRPLYPAGMQPLLRAGVARRLIAAQHELEQYHYSLKVWDAYRPKKAQQELWDVVRNPDFVANPKADGGSLHSLGVAVDVTLIDEARQSVSMPTDFDNFTPAAMLYYHGPDENVRNHLRLLQWAMSRAGFYGLRTEWWHFTPSDWARYVPKRTIPAAAHKRKMKNAVAIAP